MRTLIIIAASLVLYLSVAHARQNDPVKFSIDLTPFAGLEQLASGDEPIAIPLPGSADVHHLPELSVDLLSLDDTYYWGQTFDYEVVVRNTSSDTLTIPVSGDVTRFQGGSHERSTAVSGAIYLELGSADGETRASMAPQIIFGSELSPDSLRTLNPGESALIRVRSRWESFESDALAKLMSQPNNRWNVTAHVSLFPAGVLAVSTTPLQVTVLKPR